MQLHHKISGSGQPLIILHGLFGTLENWGAQITSLQSSFQVISVDLRNHGRSPHSDMMNYQLMAADVIELMDDLNLQDACIIGHSMGGKVAMQIALTYPLRINKLIVVDISPVTYSAHHDDIFTALSSINLSTLNSRTAADKQLQPLVSDDSVRAFLLKNLYRDKENAFAWRPNLKALADQYANLSMAPSGSKSSQPFSKPTLFIKGKNSDYILAEHQSAITSLFSKPSFKMIEGAGHWPHAEKPKIFSSIILKFLT
jgi:esterase